MKYIHIILFSVLLFSACTNNSDVVAVDDKKDSSGVWLDSLDKIDRDLLVDTVMNTEKGWKAFGAFRKFARENPKHPLAPTYHMKAASIARNIPGKALMAIEEYMAVYDNYPKDSLAPQALFLVGFTFDQALHDNERATKAYIGFINTFPEHPLAQQARESVAFLSSNQSDLEQVKTWEKENKKKK